AGVLAPADPLSRGIINALQNTGLGPTIDEGLPIVTGQDAEIASIKLIADGVQHSTIFKDTRDLADQAIVAAESILTGGEPEANDTETYDNGAKVVPSYLLEVQMGLESNYEEILVDSGYYTEEQVEAGQLCAGAEKAPSTVPQHPGGVPARSASPGPAAPRRTPWPNTSSRCGPSPNDSPAWSRSRTCPSPSRSRRSTRSAARTAPASPPS